MNDTDYMDVLLPQADDMSKLLDAAYAAEEAEDAAFLAGNGPCDPMTLALFNARRKTHRLRADYQDILIAIGSLTLSRYVETK